MKKILIITVITTILSFAGMVNVSATSVNSQSRDVTVGEVDKIDGGNETNEEAGKQETAHAPDTGLFGAGADGTSAIIAMFFAVPALTVFIWLFGYARRRRTNKKNRLQALF